jgi:hypothetical protein
MFMMASVMTESLPVAGAPTAPMAGAGALPAPVGFDYERHGGETEVVRNHAAGNRSRRRRQRRGRVVQAQRLATTRWGKAHDERRAGYADQRKVDGDEHEERHGQPVGAGYGQQRDPKEQGKGHWAGYRVNFMMMTQYAGLSAPACMPSTQANQGAAAG